MCTVIIKRTNIRALLIGTNGLHIKMINGDLISLLHVT
jgi:GTPase Era involved in 16S rRNA processing